MSLCITDLYEHALLEHHLGLNHDPPAELLNSSCCRRMRIFRKTTGGSPQHGNAETTRLSLADHYVSR